MKLEELMVDTKSAWIEFPGCEGFEVEVANLSRKELMALRKRSLKTKYNRRDHLAEEELDEEKFIHEFTLITVKNWKGLKLKYLEDLILVDLGDNDPEAFLEFTLEDAEMLIRNSSEFDTWVNEVVFDLANFRSESKRKVVEKTRKVAT